MYGTEEALKTNLEMKYADDDYPTNSASSDMETDSYEGQSSQSDIVSGDEDCQCDCCNQYLKEEKEDGKLEVKWG